MKRAAWIPEGAERTGAIGGEGFDPERSGLEILTAFDGIPPSGIVRVASLYAISAPRWRPRRQSAAIGGR